MIRATRLDNTCLVINAQLIATVEATPDTLITLTTDRKVVVRESVGEIIRRVITYLRQVYGAEAPSALDDAAGRSEEPGWTPRPS